MPLLPDEWIQDLLNRVNIRDVVERYVPLQQKGSRYWACCPFHHEKTPSFSVTPERGMFYCYGCHKGGSAIQFVAEIEKINFREACEKLAEECGLPLPTESFSREQGAKRERDNTLRRLNRAAALLYVEALRSPSGAEALRYLRGRGLTDADIVRNGIGFSPNDWQQIGDALLKQGFTEAQLAEAGLRKRSKGRSYDMFRNRVMFPIIDMTRNVIGFGGRVMDDSQPKYLNTPETPIFSKRRNLYHLNVIHKLQGLSAILLMEGYMDVVGADHFGISNSVATLGTALTADQARMLKRWSVPVYISYDGDSAGLKAAERAIGILEAAGVDCRVMAFPDGMDPDEFLRAHGREGFEDLKANALEPIAFRFQRIRAGLDLSSPPDRERYVEGCLEVLRGVGSAVLRERFARQLAAETGYSERSILHDAETSVQDPAIPQVPQPERRGSVRVSRATPENKAENYIASYVVAYPDKMKWISDALCASDFDNPANAAIFESVRQSASEGRMPSAGEVLAGIEDEAMRSHAARLFERLGELRDATGDPDAMAQGCVVRLLVRRGEKALHSMMEQQAQCTNEAERAGIKRQILLMTENIQKLRQELGRPGLQTGSIHTTAGDSFAGDSTEYTERTDGVQIWSLR